MWPILKFVLIVIQVARVFYYLSAAALQYLAPTILLLFSVLTLRTLGRFTIHKAKFRFETLLHWVVFLATCLHGDLLRHWLVRENLSSLRPRSRPMISSTLDSTELKANSGTRELTLKQTDKSKRVGRSKFE